MGSDRKFCEKEGKWLQKYSELPYGDPTDATCRIVMSNINTEQFFRLTVQLLHHTIDRILEMAEKEGSVHKKVSYP